MRERKLPMPAAVPGKRTALVLVLLLVGACALTLGAAIHVSWNKTEVIPVVLVKPGVGGFEPIEGAKIGNRWQESDVRPVILVKPGYGGFEPREGRTIGNRWSKSDVLPVMLVESSENSFVPLRLLTGESNTGPQEHTETPRSDEQSSSATASPSLLESRIAGEFEGWEGETIVQLTNGQIWQQSEYFYHYHYAYMPEVLIFKSGAGYKMKVQGVEKAVGVKQLK